MDHQVHINMTIAHKYYEYQEYSNIIKLLKYIQAMIVNELHV